MVHAKFKGPKSSRKVQTQPINFKNGPLFLIEFKEIGGAGEEAKKKFAAGKEVSCRRKQKLPAPAGGNPTLGGGRKWPKASKSIKGVEEERLVDEIMATTNTTLTVLPTKQIHTRKKGMKRENYITSREETW